AAPVFAVTVWVQLVVSGRTPRFYGWVRPVLVLAVIVGVLVALAGLRRWKLVVAGGAVALAGLLAMPAAWAVSETANSTLNATLPQAGPRGGAAGGTFGSAAFGDSTNAEAQLADWLRANSSGERWQLVVSSAMNASTLVATQDISVMALGGFMGSDPSLDLAG